MSSLTVSRKWIPIVPVMIHAEPYTRVDYSMFTILILEWEKNSRFRNRHDLRNFMTNSMVLSKIDFDKLVNIVFI